MNTSYHIKMNPEVGLKLSKNSNRKIYFIFDTKILFNYEYKDFLKTSKDTLLSPFYGIQMHYSTTVGIKWTRTILNDRYTPDRSTPGLLERVHYREYKKCSN